MADDMTKLTAFCQERGFIWGPSPELYGGLSGFYEYGPLGKLLKNNVENTIRKVFALHDVWEVECPTIMPAVVWKASGHLGNFTDPVIKDEDGNAYRTDKLIEDHFAAKGTDAAPYLAKVKAPFDYLEIIKEHKIQAPSKKPLVPEILEHNLMMATTIGHDLEAYNRPETATTTYLPFVRYFDYFRKKLPFSVYQIGKAYRNEISPRQFTLRMREFTQAESQIFLFKDQKQGYPAYDKVKGRKLPLWDAKAQLDKKKPTTMTVEEARKKKILKNDAFAYTVALAYELFTSIGIPESHMRIRQHGPDEKAFYADDAWDIEVKLSSFGWTEMCGVHDRTDYDLKQHGEAAKKALVASDETHKKEIPHILEIAFGPDRMVLAVLDLTYDPKKEKEGKTTLSLPSFLAPIQVQIFPLVKKDGMPEKAREIFENLVGEFTCSYDAAGSIGRRYLRAAMQGTPYCVTVDGDTMKDGTVTLRDRDTEKQVRVKADELSAKLHDLLKGKKQL
ncbi:glycine--tRNA ligase [Candidatus Woesearchaeota archaeon]|nr:glycine--tRNA ligase [Candidatus Woesearchaeota archaeon]